MLHLPNELHWAPRWNGWRWQAANSLEASPWSDILLRSVRSPSRISPFLAAFSFPAFFYFRLWGARARARPSTENENSDLAAGETREIDGNLIKATRVKWKGVFVGRVCASSRPCARMNLKPVIASKFPLFLMEISKALSISHGTANVFLCRGYDEICRTTVRSENVMPMIEIHPCKLFSRGARR